MPCYHPVPAWYAKQRNPSGKRGIVFSPQSGVSERRRLEVPCGKCVGCQLEKSRQWALRCMHEVGLHERNCFITLTYADEHLPKGGTLVPEHYVDFMKRLRWHGGEGIRFFHCGEYGEKLGRPHHHAILFNHDFSDKRLYSVENGVRLYESPSLENLWGYGMCAVGDATFESAAYIARYALKKIVGPDAKEHYSGRVPEYLTMSRRPGIGRGFVDKYRTSIYAFDEVIVRGHPCKPPRYYDKVQESKAPSVLNRVKARRRAAAAGSADNSGTRLVVREMVKHAAVNFLKRGLETD